MPKSNARRKADAETASEGDRTETDLGVLEPESEGDPRPPAADDGGEPAQMDVRIRGTPSAVAEGARRLDDQRRKTKPPPVEEPKDEPPVDENAVLLADPLNMVLVTRQLPRVFELASGREVRCATRVEKFDCPITRAEIEDEVFERHGGRKYKVTIHPNTTTGEAKILGAFTIEHPDSEALPVVADPEADEAIRIAQEAEIPTGGEDATLRETDPFAQTKIDLQRRLERARMKKEIAELEHMVQEAEGKEPGRATKTSDQDAKDREIAELKAQLAEKKQNEKFDGLRSEIAELARTVQLLAAKPPAPAPAAAPENSIVMKMFEQSQKHSIEMVELVKSLNKPQAVAAPVVSPEDSLDKMLGRFEKMKNAFGSGDSRVSKFQDQLLEMAMEKFMDGGGETPEEEDTLKFAIKQMTPVLKTYVEKQVEKEEGGGKDVSKERVREIYEQAAQKAAQDLVKKWKEEGVVVTDPRLPPQQRKPGIPARQTPPARVVGRTKTAEGVVEHIRVEPTDLSGKKGAPKPPPAATPPAREVPKQEEEEKVRYTEMPGVGKVEIPAPPGEMRYDRVKSVNYVLDSILSEISEGIYKHAAENPESSSCVPSDALEYLDEEILAEIWKATSGPELETALGRWGDAKRLDAIKKAGADEQVSSWLRRVIRTIQDAWNESRKKQP